MSLRSLFPKPTRDIAFPLAGSVLLFGFLVGGGLLYQVILGSGTAERLVTTMLIDAIIVIGIQIYIGNTGILSFGHVGFGAIAGYVFAVSAIAPEDKIKRIPKAPFGLTDVQVSPGVAILLAVAFTVVAAMILGVGLARSGAESGAVAATVITLALLFVTHEVAKSWSELTGGNRGGLSFGIGESLDGRVLIFVVLFLALVVARSVWPVTQRSACCCGPRRQPGGTSGWYQPAGATDGGPSHLGRCGVCWIRIAGVGDRVNPSRSVLLRLHHVDPGHVDRRRSQQCDRCRAWCCGDDCQPRTHPTPWPRRFRGVRHRTRRGAARLDFPREPEQRGVGPVDGRVHDLATRGNPGRLGARRMALSHLRPG